MAQVILLTFNVLALLFIMSFCQKYRNSCMIEQQKALQLLVLSLNFDAVALI